MRTKIIEAIKTLWNHRRIIADLKTQIVAQQIDSANERTKRTADFAQRALKYEERIAEFEIVTKVAVWKCSGNIAIPLFKSSVQFNSKSLRIWKDLERNELRSEVR